MAEKPIYRDGEIVGAYDWLGDPFYVGEQVLYCIGAGRSQLMAVGECLEIVGEPSHRRVKNKVLDVWEIQEFTSVKVKVRTLKTSGEWGNEERTRPAWVNPLNITSLHGKTVIHGV